MTAAKEDHPAHGDESILQSLKQYAEEILGARWNPGDTARMDQREARSVDRCAEFDIDLDAAEVARVVLRMCLLLFENIKDERTQGRRDDETLREVERKLTGIALAAARTVTGTRSEGD